MRDEKRRGGITEGEEVLQREREREGITSREEEERGK